jgi:hypothetical protein
MHFGKTFSLVDWFKQFKRAYSNKAGGGGSSRGVPVPDERELTHRFTEATTELQVLGYFRAKSRKSADKMEKIIYHETCFR